MVKEQIPELDASQILEEPIMRNTAPCIIYGCMKISQLNPNAVIVVAPSDHTIGQPEAFSSAINQSMEAADSSKALITLGIKPSRPDTGYGYIQYTDKTLKSDNSIHKVKLFTEKPNLELAQTFLQSGDFLWNAGIFIWSAKSILQAFKQFLPDMFEIFDQGKYFFNTVDEKQFVSNAYQQCTNISIDFGVMEKAENVYVLPANFGWSDLGTWSSIYEMADKDYLGNAVIPSEHVIMYHSTNCVVNVPKDKLVILNGLNDFIVAENNNILLICPKDEEQQIREIVADVKSKFGTDFV